MTLPIGNDTTLAALLPLFNTTEFLPRVNVASILNQYQVNDLVSESVLLLDQELEKRAIAIGTSPPNSSNPSQNRSVICGLTQKILNLAFGMLHQEPTTVNGCRHSTLQLLMII